MGLDLNKCCDRLPTVCKCTCTTPSESFGYCTHCGLEYEMILCEMCGRVVLGADEESVKDWNDGKTDGYF